MNTQPHLSANRMNTKQGSTSSRNPTESVVGNIDAKTAATTESTTNIGPEIAPISPSSPATDRPEIVPQSPTPEISEPLGDDPKKWQEEELEQKKDREFSEKAERDNMNEHRGYNETREPAPVNPRESDKGAEETEEFPR